VFPVSRYGVLHGKIFPNKLVFTTTVVKKSIKLAQDEMTVVDVKGFAWIANIQS